MKRCLKKTKKSVFYYKNGKKIIGVPPGVWGDLSGVWGDLTHVWGDLTGMMGNLSDCELTKTDRDGGVSVEDLIEEDN